LTSCEYGEQCEYLGQDQYSVSGITVPLQDLTRSMVQVKIQGLKAEAFKHARRTGPDRLPLSQLTRMFSRIAGIAGLPGFPYR
jgi:hypothetical protein